MCLCEVFERNNEEQPGDAGPYYKMSFHESGDEESWFEIAKVIRLLLQARRNVRTYNCMTPEVITMHLEHKQTLRLRPELIKVHMF